MGMSSSKSNTGKVVPISVATIASIPLERTDKSQLNEIITADSLWEKGIAIIHVIRRPGCPLCREHAQTLAEIRVGKMMSAENIRLVGIVHECDYIQDIIDFRAYFGGNPIYFDREKLFFKALGNRWSGYEALMWPAVIQAISRVMSRGISGSNNGEGRLLGGLIVASKEGIFLEHREEYFGDFAPTEVILQAIDSATR